MENKKIASPINNWFTSLLKAIIWTFSCLVLFVPFIVDNGCFFPFVGPKSLYFMAFAQIIFFAWVILAIIDPNYRPQKNIVLWSVLAYLVVFTVSTFSGVDPSRSFWSKFERMGGLLMHIHLFLYLLAIASFFKTKDDWKKIFSISVISGLIMGSFFLLANNKAWTESILGRIAGMNWGGMTIGNSSFLATYLLFNLFIAIYLLIESFKDFNAKKRVFNIGEIFGGKGLAFKVFGMIAFSATIIYFVQLSTINVFLFVMFVAVSLIILLLSEPIFYALAASVLFGALFFSGGRAALYSFYGGMGLIFLFWMSFKYKNNTANWIGKILLVSFLIGSLIFVSLIAKEGTWPYNKFYQSGGAARLIIWQGMWPRISERPLLGWGPENFELAFYKSFDPRLFLKEYGQEIWFDRAHNVFVDTLVATGWLGLITYLGMFAALSYAFFKIYKKRGDEGFWEFAVFSSLLVAYFVQNLTVFDMITSFMISFFVIAFAASQAWEEPKIVPGTEIGFGKVVLIAFVSLIFLFSFNNFFTSLYKADQDFVLSLNVSSRDNQIIQSAVQAKATPAQLQAKLDESTKTRIDLYESILDTQIGRYQHIDFWADPVIEKIWSKSYPEPGKLALKKEIQYLIDKTKEIYNESAYNCPDSKNVGVELGKDCIKDYRLAIKIAYLLDAYAVNYNDPTKLIEAEQYYKEGLQISPRNPRNYWSLAQNQYYQGKANEALDLVMKSIELEPRILSSYNIALNISENIKDQEKTKQIVLAGYQASLDQIKNNPGELSYYTSAIFFAQKANDVDKINEVIQKALAYNPDWAEEIKKVAGIK